MTLLSPLELANPEVALRHESDAVHTTETANGGDWTVTITPTRVPNRAYPTNDPNGLLYFRLWYSQGGVKYVTQPQIMSRQEAKPLVQAAFSPMDRAGFRMLGIKQVMILRVASAEYLPGAAATANAG